jgi:uncharacterized RDD family membrane protein YckC
VNEQEHSETDLIQNQEEKTLEEQIASPKQRFGTLLLDILFINIIYFSLGFIFSLALIMSGEEAQAKRDVFIFSLILPFIYYSVLEALTGRTFGKYIMGTKAVKADGTKLSTGRAIFRTLCRHIPFDVFSFLGGEGPLRGWHDKVSKTIVISVKEAKQPSTAG